MSQYDNDERSAIKEQQHLPFQFNTISEYLGFHGFALRDDLLRHGFKESEIDKGVYHGNICCSCCPQKYSDRKIPVLYWRDDPAVLDKLAELGNKKAGLIGKIYASVSGKSEMSSEEKDISESFKEL